MNLDDLLRQKLQNDAIEYDAKANKASQEKQYFDKQVYRFAAIYASQLLRWYREEYNKLYKPKI